jgi:hypothetical protein
MRDLDDSGTDGMLSIEVSFWSSETRGPKMCREGASGPVGIQVGSADAVAVYNI